MFRSLFLALIACLIAACTDGERSASKQVLRLNIFTEPPTLDSRKATDSTSAHVLLMLFEGLTRIGDDHQPKPAVAEKILISKDQRTYTFILRETHWSNGDKLTAEDFLYAWQTILDPHFPALFAYKLYVIENAQEVKEGKLPLSSLGVKVLDKKTLEVTLRYPTPYFLELTAFPTFFPVNKKIAQKNPEWASESGAEYVSNGPFKLLKWQHESEIIAVKNSAYWDAQAVKLDQLHLSMIDDTTTEFYMYEMGELDWAGSPLSNLPPEFIPELKKQTTQEDLRIHFYPAAAVYYYKLNTLQYPLNNLKIRKSLAYAINRHNIVEHITQAGQKPATALVPPMPGWQVSNCFKDGNTEHAKHLFLEGLHELGITLEQFPRLKLSYNTNREHQKIAQAIQHQWKETLGIEVELVHFDWKVYLTKISSQDYQIGRMGWIGDFHDPVSFLEPYKFRNDPETGGNNDTGWEHPDYISYLVQAQSELDLIKRAHLLRKAEELLIAEMPIIPIYFAENGYLKKPYVHGVYLSSLGVVDFKKAYLE